MERFYETVTVVKVENGFAIELDGKPVKTRRGARVYSEKEALVYRVAEEWRAQEKAIIPASMPMFQLLTAVIDLGPSQSDEWVDRIISYADSELICYREETLESLYERQCRVWDPYLQWLLEHYNIKLQTGRGIAFIHQSPETTQMLRCLFKEASPSERFALKALAEITSSAVLPYALWRGPFREDEVFEASRLDEVFQIERWGEDDEAMQRTRQIRKDYDTVNAFLKLSH
ncbi:MAG: ATP12 family protein [Pseudomonadota bacterium]